MKDITIINKPAIRIVGIQCRTSNTPEAGPQDIPKLWERFYNENVINQIPNKVSNDVMALYCDYEGDYTRPYTLVIGCQVNSFESIPEGMISKIIPEGSYGVYKAVGEHPASLINTWTTIWQGDLDRTYTGDYELYGDKFFSWSPQEVEVYIAIRPASDLSYER